MSPTKIFHCRILKEFVNQITLLCDGKCHCNAAKTVLWQLIVAYLLNCCVILLMSLRISFPALETDWIAICRNRLLWSRIGSWGTTRLLGFTSFGTIFLVIVLNIVYLHKYAGPGFPQKCVNLLVWSNFLKTVLKWQKMAKGAHACNLFNL